MAGAVILIIAGAVAPAAADPEAEPTPDDGLVVQEYREGEPGPSTVAYAEQEGISVKEAEKRVGWQTAFWQATSAIEEAMPDAYAASEITGHFTATVTFAGDVPAGAAEYLKDIPEHVDIKLIDGAARALVGLRAEMEALYHKVNKDPDVDDATGQFDTNTGVIKINVKPRVNTKSARSDLRAKIATYKADRSRTPVELNFVDHWLGKTTAEARGGSYLDPHFLNWGCTTAFVVKNSAGTRGLLTANHCAGQTSMDLRNPNSSTETQVSRLGRSSIANVDLAWYSRGNFTITNKFHADYNIVRNVVNAASPGPGGLTERFGRTSGRRYFHTVYFKDVCSNGGYCRLTVMKNAPLLEDGDSGGPWFYNSTAHGVSYGRIWFGTSIPEEKYRDAFTTIYSLNAALGLGLQY